MELYKNRRFGEIFNDTVVFFRYHYKAFFKSTAPLFLSLAIGAVVLFYFLSRWLNQLNDNSYNPSKTFGNNDINIFNVVGTFGAAGIIGLIFFLYFLSILCYSKLATQQVNPITFSLIWKQVKKYFFKILAAGILYTVFFTLIAVIFSQLFGPVFIFIANLLSAFLIISTLLTFHIIVFEDKKIFYAFSESFRLIKGNWWKTLGIMFMSYLISITFYILLYIPILLIGFALKFLNISNSKILMYATMGTTELFLLLVMFLVLFFNTILITFIYMSYKEEKDGIGEEEIIDTFGNIETTNG